MSGFVFGPFRLDAAMRELRRNGELIALPPRVFACLLYLIERRERAVGRDELIDAMWDGRSASDVQLAQLIVQCRRAVDDDGQTQRAIRTVAGFGYCWVEAVQTDATQSAATMDASSATPEEQFTLVPAAVTGSLTRQKRLLLRWLWLVIGAGFVAALLLLAAHLRRDPVEPTNNSAAPTVVAPIRVDDAEARWLRLGGMDVIIERLRRNQVPVLSSEATVALVHGSDALSAGSDVQALAAHANVVVDIATTHAGRAWRMTATLHSKGTAPQQATAEAEDPLTALYLLADRVSGLLGRPPAYSEAAGETGMVALTLQRARAALLANDPNRARELLLSNPTLVADEPLLRQQLADVDIRAGRYADARAALDELLAHTDRDAVFRARLYNARGMVSIRTGRFADAGSDFSAALELLDGGGDAITLGRAWLGRGISRTSLQDYPGAQADYARARDMFENAGDAGSVARVDSDIGALEILRGHMAQADSYLQRARDRFHDFGMVQEEINTLQLSFVARRAQLKNADAAAAIDSAWTSRDRIVSRSSLLSTGLYRVESLLVDGRQSEAGSLLDSLTATAQPAAGAEADRWLLMRAAHQQAVGQFDEALKTLMSASEEPHASADDDSVRAAVALLRARLERKLHRSDSKQPSTSAVAALESPTPRTPLRLLAAANRAWARDDAAAAEEAFAAALRLADDQGIAETLVEVVVDDVDYLLAAGRLAEAATVAARVGLRDDEDFECALVQLRLAHALRNRTAWSVALERAQRLAGERTVPTELIEAPL